MKGNTVVATGNKDARHFWSTYIIKPAQLNENFIEKLVFYKIK